jgi:hypothetical protein
VEFSLNQERRADSWMSRLRTCTEEFIWGKGKFGTIVLNRGTCSGILSKSRKAG